MAETVQGAGIERKAVPGAGGPVEKAAAMASGLWGRVEAMAPGKRNALVASVCAVAALCAGLLWYVQRPDWKPLFAGLDGKDVQQVSQELSAAGIRYQMTADGTGIEVPAELIEKARMEVAAKGMPQSGRMGFELFDKPNWVGSEFDERVNYQRALEGELEHTIGTLGAVRSARVHLVLPQPSLFLAQEKAAKASVVLTLKRGVMPPDQAEQIRNLVAGAVENLGPDQVTLLDAAGRVNMKPRTVGGVEDPEVEAAMESKLVAMLEPLAGRDNVRATVNVSYDQGREERTDEMYDPTQVVALTKQTSEQTSPSTQRPSGVPGTASNTPAGAAPGAVAGSAAAAAPGTPPLLKDPALPVYPQGSQAAQTLKEENATYAISKHTVRTEQGPGRVRRVTAAVLVNDRMLMEGTGKTEHAVWKPRSGEEMKRLEELAQAAVGFDLKRGDSVVMQNISFTSNVAEAKPSAVDKAMDGAKSLLHTQPGLLKSALTGMCVVLLILFVVRPAVRQITSALNEPMMLPSGSAQHAPGGMYGANGQYVAEMQESPELSAPKLEAAELPESAGGGGGKRRLSSSKNQVFDYVAESVERDPAQATRLVESWIGTAEAEA